jgi:hypothetical protein
VFTSLQAAANPRSRTRGVSAAVLVFLLGAAAFVWLVGSRNRSPAGYVGYLTKGAVLTRCRSSADS